MPNFQPWEYVDGNATIRVAGITPNPKKMTGTRVSKVLGLDGWGTPFQAWCEITRVAEPPFDGNKYTDAGNALEPKIIAWCKESVSPYVYTPEEFYGVEDAKKHTGYDFFHDNPILGGMWDAVILDGPLGKGKPLGYVEAKTSSRPQDWVDGPPMKYAIQGLLYGHLDGLDRVYIPVRFMEPHEYDDPHACECDDENTELYELSVRDTLIDGRTISELATEALAWYQTHVVGNVSPPFHEKSDKEYLKIMRHNEVKDEGLEALARKAAVLEAKIETIRESNDLDALEKDLKALKDKRLKPALVEMFGENDETVSAYGWKVRRTERTAIDKDKLASDDLLDTYQTTTVSYTLTKEKN